MIDAVCEIDLLLGLLVVHGRRRVACSATARLRRIVGAHPPSPPVFRTSTRTSLLTPVGPQ
jgi:hypothetical protein